MASGSQNMTTYNARIVTGSDSAALPDGALLLSGAGRADDATGDTWIFLDSKGGTTNPWGIKHDQANNKLQIFGSGTNSISVHMSTGDTYILGKVGIGYDPKTSGNTYKLYVNGSSYFTDHMYIERNNSAHIYLINKNWTKGTNPSSQTYSAIEYNDTNNSRVALLEATLDTSGNSRFNIYLVPNVASSTSWSGIVLQKTNADVLTVNIAGTTTVNGTVHANGGYLQSTLNGNTVQIGSQNGSYAHFTNTKDIPFWFNKVIYSDGGFNIYNTGDNVWRNGYLKVNKSDGGDCYIELRRQGNADWRILNSGGNLYFQSNWTSAKGSYFNVLQLDYNTGRAHFKEYVYASYYNASCGVETPADGSYWLFANSDGFFRKSSRANIAAKIDLEHKWVRIGGDTMSGDLLFSNSGTTTRQVRGIVGDNDYWRIAGGATAANAGWMEIATADDGNEPIYVRQYTGAYTTIKRTLTLLDASGNTTFPGSLYLNNKGTNIIYNGPNDAANGVGGALNNLVFSAWYGVSFTTSCTGQTYTNKNAFSINCRNGYAYCGRMYNAVWNDYAEYRESKITKPGICVQENDNGCLTRTKERLIPGCSIVSDTYGYAEGETEKADTPVAVSGRVLAYTYRPREEYHAGQAVCSAPNGTIDIMTREEIRDYPDAIIGIVSEIPEYKEWGTGQVKVDGRIWVKVK